jgi:hypothetical protein
MLFMYVHVGKGGLFWFVLVRLGFACFGVLLVLGWAGVHGMSNESPLTLQSLDHWPQTNFWSDERRLSTRKARALVVR